MLPCSLSLISHATADAPRRRTQAIGWWTASGSITIAAGPIVGGLLLGVAGWRSIFLINLPVCLIGAGLVWRIEDTIRASNRRGFDVPGQCCALVTLVALTAAVIEANPLGIFHPLIVVLAMTGAIAVCGFVAIETRSAAPMLSLGLFRTPTFSAAIMYGAAANFSYYGLIFILSLYLQHVLGYAPVATGLAFLPLTATFFVVNLISGWWAGRSGPKPPMITGMLVAAAGFLLLYGVASAATPYWSLLPAFTLIPAGMGLGVPAMTSAVLASVSRDRSGIASAVLNTGRQAAGAVGVALFGALVAGLSPIHIIRGVHHATLIASLLLASVAVLTGWMIESPTRIPLDERTANPPNPSLTRHSGK